MATVESVPDATEQLRRALTQVDPARRRKDVTMRVLVYIAFALAVLPLISLIWSVLVRGVGRFDAYFLLHSMRNVFGGMDTGGAYHAILGTLLITGWATLISVPIGLMVAIYLVEYGTGALARSVTFFVDVMTGIPSIVAGLFAFALFYMLVGPDSRSGIVGAVALA
ncbi:MAG: phosphate ABC transporter, permease protein PstA, partial [Actinobacteria bacterium]|nr:phosphate ABC transporter, permease protein PstA [Actinomycetota bacterium]